jgi:hypothetical protein
VKNRELSSKATAISSEQMGRLLNEKNRLTNAWPSKKFLLKLDLTVEGNAVQAVLVFVSLLAQRNAIEKRVSSQANGPCLVRKLARYQSFLTVFCQSSIN